MHNSEGRPANGASIYQNDPGEYYELDISDPMKPRIQPRNKDGLRKPCDCTSESDCVHKRYLDNRGAPSSKGEPIPSNGQPNGMASRPIIPVEDRNDRGKYGDALPHDKQVRHSPQGPPRGAKRGPSDDLEREAKTQREGEREKDLDRPQPKHPTNEELYRHGMSKGGAQQQPIPSGKARIQELRGTPSPISVLSDLSWTPSSQGFPNPNVPIAPPPPPPLSGPSGRRRPRRPRPET
jgi:hypothetical protein